MCSKTYCGLPLSKMPVYRRQSVESLGKVARMGSVTLFFYEAELSRADRGM